MPDPNSSQASADDPLDAVIAEYVQQVEAGEVPDREALLTRHPDLAERLRAFFADCDHLDRQAADPNRTTDLRPTPEGELPRVRFFGDYHLPEVSGEGPGEAVRLGGDAGGRPRARAARRAILVPAGRNLAARPVP